ncbi:IS110 family transposase [Pseudoramibacter faecis]|uniref:IS110 family transposase n=1 Tax=Pseudoramibacter faecis TaxID=3108534 RepID=UPI003CCA558E
MLNAVGIDISKGKSTVAVLRPAGEIVHKPFHVRHSVRELSELVSYVRSLDGETRVVMETTGHYKVKSDPADAKKIAQYALDKWPFPRQHSAMDNTRAQMSCSAVPYALMAVRNGSITSAC